MSRERHNETETLYKQRELSIGGTASSDPNVSHREHSLRSQISDVQRRIRRHREEHLGILGPNGTKADLDRRQQQLIGQLRALDFVIDHHRAIKTELVGNSLSLELDEARSMKRYAAAKQANEVSKQYIDALEADIARLISVRNKPYPSATDSAYLQAECSALDTQIHALEMEISLTIGRKESDVSTREEAVSVINDLVGQLTVVESYYAKLCDSMMESFSSLMELHEKKLRLYKIQREFVDEFGESPGDVEIDFESGDIETDKTCLKNLHKDLKFCNEARNACIIRIDELKHILSTIHV